MDKEQKYKEKAVLVGLSSNSFLPIEDSNEATMDELEALLETAGGICVGRVIQSRDLPDPRTFIGEGKAREVAELLKNTEADLAVFDNELSPSQTVNLEDIFDLRVLDRSSLILDIFADRAKTREGRLQVELATLKYTLPRLTGRGIEMSRVTGGGGIGLRGRGAGETKLEIDRRNIRSRIARLEEELERVRRIRSVQRRARSKSGIPVVSLVGYTNAGKSSLLNKLTGAGVEANNRLFDTLDPTSRVCSVSDTLDVLLVDTVGFIRKLPHHLVEAFKATLEELTYASLLVHVIDASNPEWEEQAKVVDALIRELGVEDAPLVRVYNKCDLCPKESMPRDVDGVVVSAKTGEGLDGLSRRIAEILDDAKYSVSLKIPHDRAGIMDRIYSEGVVSKVDYDGDFIFVEAVCNKRLFGVVKDYML